MATSIEQHPLALYEKLMANDAMQRLYGITDAAMLVDIKTYLGVDESQWHAISLAGHVDVTLVSLSLHCFPKGAWLVHWGPGVMWGMWDYSAIHASGLCN